MCLIYRKDAFLAPGSIFVSPAGYTDLIIASGMGEFVAYVLRVSMSHGNVFKVFKLYDMNYYHGSSVFLWEQLV